MAFELSEEVFKRGMLTRKAIHNIQSKTHKWMKDYKCLHKFDFYRERIEEFAAAKRKAQRAEIVVALDFIGWNGVFSADDIAEILLHSEDGEIARCAALAKLATLEKSYEENKRKAAILRKEIERIIPGKWKHEITVSASGVALRFSPPVKKEWSGVSVEGAGKAYAFLQMTLLVRLMLRTAHIPFTFDAFEEVSHVWAMAESAYCYNYSLETSGKEVLERERKSYKDYFAKYNLPEHIKATILDAVRQSIASIKCGVYSSPEDGSYNSLVYKPMPDKVEWGLADNAA